MGLIQPVPGLPVGRPIRDGWLVQPKNTLPAITEMWAFVSVDPKDGNEGLIAAPTAHGTLPLIAADKTRLREMLPVAKRIAEDAFPDQRVRLVKLSTRTIVIDNVLRDGIPDELKEVLEDGE